MIFCVVKGLSLKKPNMQVYWMVTLLGAIVMIATGIAPFSAVIDSFTSTAPVNPLKILLLFISMTAISVTLDEAGFFSYLANKAVKRAGGSQIILFVKIYITVSILTVFTSNDIVILTFTPFILFFCKNANISPIPYLVGEFIGANTFSMVLLIGNPTNIYLSVFCGINFFEYLKIMVLPSLAGGTVAFLFTILLFRSRLKEKMIIHTEQVTINKPVTIVGLIFLAVCTVLIAISEYIGLEMAYVSGASAVLLLLSVIILRKDGGVKPTAILKRLPWQLIPFVLSMFVMAIGLEHSGVTAKIAEILNSGSTVYTYGITSAIACNIMNNIPMSVTYGSVLKFGADLQSVFATIIGSNIGAYFTPIGALAGIMWNNILKSHGEKMPFLTFCRNGLIIGIPTLLVTLSVLALIL